MKRRGSTILKWAGTPVLALGLTLGAAQQVDAGPIYLDNFDGLNTVDLNGTTPDTTTGGNSWTASTLWTADGSIASVGSRGRNDSAFLPFVPASGTIYTLSATLDQPFGGNNNPWAAIGFADTNNTTRSFWANDAAPWVLYRPSSNVDSFLGPATGGSADEGDHTGPITLSIVLDTTSTAWTAEWFINGATVRGPVAYGTNPDINYVGLHREDGAGADFSHFELAVVPEPGSLALLGLGGLLVARRRRG